LWRIIEEYGVNILYTAPTAIRAVIRWGDHWVMKHDLSLAAPPRIGGRADQSRGLDVVSEGGRGDRCPIVDTWWQTETGAIMITPLPGAVPTKPGADAAVLRRGCSDRG
jgi:acetyl-CoA synthetase